MLMEMDSGGNLAVPTSSTTVCEDPDGDGFGWDGFATCLVEATSQSGSTTQSTSAVTACVDSDGDGFGWVKYTIIISSSRVY